MLENNSFQVLLREKLESRLIVQNMQINLIFLMMAMLMMTMMIIYPGKIGSRFVLSHNQFTYFLVTMFPALVICLCIYSLYYEFRILFMSLLFCILRVLCIIFICIIMYYIYYYCYYLYICLIISIFFIRKDCLDNYCFSIFLIHMHLML